MENLLSKELARLAEETKAQDGFEPVFFDPSSDGAEEALDDLLKSGRVISVVDEIRDQIAGLIETLRPDEDLEGAELEAAVDAHLNGTPEHRYGLWVYYPWSRRLVHVLGEKEFRHLRTSRNRNKITFEEQEVLRGMRIGIVGLSIGHAAAVTLTMEEIGGELHLADFDHLELSNMNRINTGVHSLGVNKAVIAARDVYEMNPFAKVFIQTAGVNESNIDAFLTPGGRALDMVYEECDDLHMKLLVREHAKALRIPVFMETSDRGLMDVERFDREPDRPIFHGLTGDVSAKSLKGLTTLEKVPIVLKIMNMEGISERMAASMVDIETTLASWPQLASEVALGAALNVDTARRVALGQLNVSGRFYVDIAEIISDDTSGEISMGESDEVGIVPEALGFDLPPLTPVSREITDEHVRTLAAYAGMAFSGGNVQPWRLVYRDGLLRCYHVEELSKTFLDYRNRASHLAFGSLAENLSLAASAMAIDAEISEFPDPADPLLVCTARLSPRPDGKPVVDPLVHQIIRRVTNRRLGSRIAIPSFELEALSRSAAEAGCKLQWLTDPESMDAMAEILSSGDFMRMTSKIMHGEMMNEMRWNTEEVERTRDGLDVATLEMSAADLAGLRLIRSWKVMKVTGAIGGGLGLKRPMRKCIKASSGIGLLTGPGFDGKAFFRGGRALQRIWLEITAKEILFQPVTPITFLFYRLEQGGGEGLKKKELSWLRSLREDYLKHLQIPEGHAELMLFRVARAQPPTARSLRRHVDDYLEIEKVAPGA